MTPQINAMTKEECLDYVLRELAGLGELSSKKMFGGIGIFLEGVMFAKVSGKGSLYFRVDDSNRRDYEQLGSKPFYASSKKKGMPYYEVPAQVLDDSKKLVAWAHKAHSVAMINKK